MTLESGNLGSEPLFVAYAGLLGAAIGSFLNVCILRWGAEPKQSVVRPPSRCPRCGRGVAWYDNIPIVSWLLLRGRCRGCREPISLQYPLIELATALLWAFMVWRHGFGIEALRGAVFLTLLLGIAMTDARAYIIPHEFSIGGAVIAVALTAISGSEAAGIREALIGACFGAGLVLLIGELSEMLAGQEAMGGGDCALMGLVGAFGGWQGVAPVIGAGAAISVVLYMLQSLRPRARPGAPEPEVPVEASPVLRWSMLLRLLLGGGVLIAGMVVAMRVGMFGALLRAGFDGIVAAGIVYYAAFLVPSRVQGRWERVAGLLGAAVGVAVGAGFSPTRLAAAIGVALAAVWYARRAEVTASPESAEQLSAEGYLPFGVGLSLAAGVFVLLDAYSGIRVAVTEYLKAAGIS